MLKQKIAGLQEYDLPTTVEWVTQAYNYGAYGMKVVHDTMMSDGLSLDQALQKVHDDHKESNGRMVPVSPGTGNFGTPRHYKAVLRYYNLMRS